MERSHLYYHPTYMSIRMKKKKILLASGCSYTDPNFKSDASTLPPERRSGWKMWPQIMAEQLDLQTVNVGKSGKGNEWISKSILSNIIKYGDRIEKVVVLWTGADRIEHYNWTVHPLIDNYSNWSNAGKHRKYCGLNELQWSPELFKENRVYESWFRDSLLAMYTVAELCTARGIDFTFAQGVNFHLYEMVKQCGIEVSKLKKLFLAFGKTKGELKSEQIYNNILDNINQYDDVDFIELIEKGHYGGSEKFPIYKELRKKFKKHFISDYELYEFESAFDFGFHLDRGVYRIADNKYYNIANNKDITIEPYDVTKHDFHPNALGQQYMANALLKHHYKK